MIQDVETKELKVIKDDRGFLMEMLRADDKIFQKCISTMSLFKAL